MLSTISDLGVLFLLFSVVFFLEEGLMGRYRLRDPRRRKLLLPLFVGTGYSPLDLILGSTTENG